MPLILYFPLARSLIVMDASQVFFKLAVNDLQAAKHLLDGKFFPQSVFYLEQSVEKATKSFGIRFGLITEEEARTKIGHDAWKIHIKILDCAMEYARWFKGSLEQYPQLHEIEFVRRMETYWDKAIGEEKTLNELKTLLFKPKRDEELKAWLHKVRLATRTEEQLQKILAWLDNLDYLVRNTVESIKLSEEDVKKIKEYAKPFLQQSLYAISGRYQPFAERVKESFKLLDEKESKLLCEFALKFALKSTFCIGSLFCLSILFVPHVTTSRYPGEYPDEADPLEAYSEDTALIRMMSRFIKATERLLETLKELYGMCK